VIDPSTRRPRAGWILGIILAAGAALRLYSYFANPSLSVDDAMLALNLGTRSFPDLLRPLALEQAAPPLFLWALKALTLVGGMRDPVLRFLPLVAGCAVPYAAWRVGRQLLSERGAVLAAALTACSPILVQYSVSAKPYEVDALMTLVIVGMATTILVDPSGGRGFVRLGLAGILAILVSTPAVFVLFSTLVILACAGAVWQAPRGRAGLAALAVLWGITFAAVYFGVTRAEAMSPYLQRFWAARMLHIADLLHPGHVWDVVKRLPMQVFLPFRKLSEPEIMSWLLLLAGAGVLIRRRGIDGVLVAGPLVVMLGAAFASLYPLAPRLSLFVAPLVCILFAAALEGDHLARLGRGVWAVRAVSTAGVVGLLVAAAPTGWWPPNTRLLVSTYLARRMPGQNVYVASGVAANWTVYATDWSAPDTASLGMFLRAERSEGRAFRNAPSRDAAVADTEGQSLSLPAGDHVELLGLASGIEFREGAMFSRTEPDPGWGRREATRIRAATSAGPQASGVWVAIAFAYPGEEGALLAALDSAGGSGEQILSDRGAVLYYYRSLK